MTDRYGPFLSDVAQAAVAAAVAEEHRKIIVARFRNVNLHYLERLSPDDVQKLNGLTDYELINQAWIAQVEMIEQSCALQHIAERFRKLNQNYLQGLSDDDVEKLCVLADEELINKVRLSLALAARTTQEPGDLNVHPEGQDNAGASQDNKPHPDPDQD